MASLFLDYDNLPESKKGAYEELWGHGPQEEIDMIAGVQCRLEQPSRQVSLMKRQALIYERPHALCPTIPHPLCAIQVTSMSCQL